MGSKTRIADLILRIILKNRQNRIYVEPFTGGCNTLCKVFGHRIGSDINKYLIAMWKGLQENKERPYVIPWELYDEARQEYNNQTNIQFDDFLIGWIGWMGSYNGRFFDGGYSGHDVKGRDYISEQIRNTESQINRIKDVEFYCADYEILQLPTHSLIYCDIPYKGTKQYACSMGFNYKRFWNWCRKVHSEGHIIYVSEYTAPEDFYCVWGKEITNSLHTKNTYKATEKLFTLQEETPIK